MTRWSSRGCALLMMAFCSIAPLATAQTQAMASSADSALNVVDPKAGFSSVTRSYSGMDARYVRTGTQTKIAQLRSIAIGEPEAEVEDELGAPAIRSGDDSAEFHLSLRLTSHDRLICQYLVFYDDGGAVERTVWRRPQCADLVLGHTN